MDDLRQAFWQSEPKDEDRLLDLLEVAKSPECSHSYYPSLVSPELLSHAHGPTSGFPRVVGYTRQDGPKGSEMSFLLLVC